MHIFHFVSSVLFIVSSPFNLWLLLLFFKFFFPPLPSPGVSVLLLDKLNCFQHLNSFIVCAYSTLYHLKMKFMQLDGSIVDSVAFKHTLARILLYSFNCCCPEKKLQKKKEKEKYLYIITKDFK